MVFFSKLWVLTLREIISSFNNHLPNEKKSLHPFDREHLFISNFNKLALKNEKNFSVIDFKATGSAGLTISLNGSVTAKRSGNTSLTRQNEFIFYKQKEK